ncbi:MAG TPA: hypothetical protein DHU88_10290 [Pseudomonas sp.]|nr:hypothetical protein [Pseudomonas sp.]
MKHHRFPAWLASLALLLHLLSMSLAGAWPADSGRLLEHGDRTSLAQGEAHPGHAAAHAAAGSHEQPHAGHGGMPPCCCTGAMGLAALPVASPPVLPATARRTDARAERHSAWPSPRERWPALNPRASPLA